MELSRIFKIPRNRLLKKLFGYDEIYTIGVRSTKTGDIFKCNDLNFDVIKYSSQYWYADPLIYEYNEQVYLFAEMYDRKSFKGNIAVTQLTNNVKDIIFTPIIVEPYHMSFPMVFDWNDYIYMIPETSENHSINLYRATSFPYKWNLEYIFQTDEKYVDTIVLDKRDDRIELLTSMLDKNNPWMVKYQKLSLVKETGNISLIWNKEFNMKQNYNLLDRNGGTVIKCDEKKIIPTQVSEPFDYGVRLRFREYNGLVGDVIKCVTKDDVSVNGIDNKNIIGIHTYSTAHDIEIIDLRYMKYSPMNQYRKLII